MGKYWLQIKKSIHSSREESISRDKSTPEFSLGLGSFRQAQCDF